MVNEKIEIKIVEAYKEALKRNEVEPPEKLDYGQILLESGIDSLGFAILVARLEDELGYDPFTLMERPVYPKTFGEFVEIYTRHSEHYTE